MCIVFALSVALAAQAGDTKARNDARTLEARHQHAENAAARALERVRKDFEEWGTVTVAEPIILRSLGQFGVGQSNDFPTAARYIAAEQTDVSAAVSELTQSVLTARLAAEATVASPIPGVGTVPSPDTNAATKPGNIPTPTVPSLESKTFLDQDRFRALGDLVRKEGLSGISQRQAINLGIGDKISEMLLRKMADPPEAIDGRKLYLLMFQVACNPGWRTSQRYMADINIFFEYAIMPETGVVLSLSSSRRTQPYVVAVLPLLDAQTMELRNGQRELAGMALALAATVPGQVANVSGKAMVEYLRSFQRDAASRNALPVVNSYSTATSMGFRLSPSFMAVKNPEKPRSKSANVLIPTSFPVLAIIAIDPKEITDGRDENGKPITYTHLVTNVRYRWVLRDRRISLWPWNFELPGPSDSELLRLKRSRNLMEAYAKVELARQSYGPDAISHYPFQQQRADLWEFDAKAIGRFSYSELPTELKPKDNPSKPVRAALNTISPQKIDPTLETFFTITGSGFSIGVEAVTLGGRPCEIVKAIGDSTILAKLPAGKLQTYDTKKAVLEVLTKNGRAVADGENPDNRPFVELAVVTPNEPPKHTITIQRVPDGSSQTLTVIEQGSFKGDKLVDAAAAILAPPNGPPKIIVETPKP